MPIFELDGASPLEGFKTRRQMEALDRQKRSLSSATTPNILGGNKASGFIAARIDHLSADFRGRNVSADQELYEANLTMRARARLLEMNSPFFRKFLALLAQNVIGPQGIQLQAKVKNQNGQDTADTKRINKRIEEEWKRQNKRGRFTACGRFSGRQAQILALKNCAREGENILKHVYGFNFSPSGFSVQLLDNDQLDDQMMQQLPNGNQIRMGVEVDEFLRPLAFHLFDGHPLDPLSRNRERVRVDASKITHTAMFERPGQTRGYTWGSAAVSTINQFDRYVEAVIVASRQAAAKAFSIEKDLAEGMYTGDDDQDELDDEPSTDFISGNTGEGFNLEPGEHLNFIDPRFPSPNHKQFVQAMLRAIATGLLVDYPTLANDLEGVNFSSIRAGMLDTRDCYRIIQAWFIETWLEPIFQAWLNMALLTVLNDITLTPQQMEQITWKPRGWDWVDPLKDAQAIILKLRAGLITYSDALATLGMDFEETMTERAAEQAFIEALGIHLDTDITGDLGSETDDSESTSEPAQGGTPKKNGPSGVTEKKRVLASPLLDDVPKGAHAIEAARILFRELRASIGG